MRCLARLSFRASLAILLALLFFGAMFWAKGRDPFRRVWFKVKTEHYGKANCVAVLPKTAAPPYPVVIYLHGSGGSVLSSGNELRQIAEMGLAAVCVDYSQTNVAEFEEQFIALNNWVFLQKWTDTNRVAWVGFSVGAQRLLSFAFTHSGSPPALLTLVATGGSVRELGALTNAVAPTHRPSTLLIHGDEDEAFPVADVTRTAECLHSNGIPVELSVLHGVGHDFQPDRLLVFREIGEYCLAHLKGVDALSHYRSILCWESEANPLWLYWLPAGIWACVWISMKWRDARAVDRHAPRLPLSKGEVWLRCVAAVLGAVAAGQTALHLIPRRLPVSTRTLAIARKHLIQQKELSDFDFLVTNAIWQMPSGHRLGTLLTHVELANYNRELINWKFDEQIYRDFVLSPQIDPAHDGDVNWRRELWENFYPRIRKQNTTEAAAQIIARFLRERVTVVAASDFGVEDTKLPTSISDIWKRQICNGKGFESVYVAAMRAAGVPARLSSGGQAEFWTGSDWRSAPRPIVETLLR
jgi:dienelactone hydrolase